MGLHHEDIRYQAVALTSFCLSYELTNAKSMGFSFDFRSLCQEARRSWSS